MLVVIICLICLVVVFASLCVVCDEHLIPAVEVFIKQFDVPEEVAAVTLVAFGSAAPELMLNSVLLSASVPLAVIDKMVIKAISSSPRFFTYLPSTCPHPTCYHAPQPNRGAPVPMPG